MDCKSWLDPMKKFFFFFFPFSSNYSLKLKIILKYTKFDFVKHMIEQSWNSSLEALTLVKDLSLVEPD